MVIPVIHQAVTLSSDGGNIIWRNSAISHSNWNNAIIAKAQVFFFDATCFFFSFFPPFPPFSPFFFLFFCSRACSATQLLVEAYDASILNDIATAIQEADIGFTPNNDGRY